MTEARTEREIREKLHRIYQAAWEAENSPPPSAPPHQRFYAGKKYTIIQKSHSQDNGATDKEWKKKYMYFVRDEGIHHIFSSIAGGWLECFTDVQLMDYQVKEFGEAGKK